VWGGTRDVGRNETEKGFHQIKNFVENHKQTNVIVMSVPCKYDLEPKSCVNDEVKVYNIKLKKHLNVLDNTCIIEVDSNRDLHTRHGIHMNSKGKEQIARKIVKVMLNEEKKDPITMKHKENLRVNSEGTEVETTTMEILFLLFVHVFLTLSMYSFVVYVFLLLSMYSYRSSMYSYRCLCILIVVYVFLDAATLTEVFPCFFLGCMANARV
jgi:RNase H-fold protein (predicted Holliday junction resolvase)